MSDVTLSGNGSIFVAGHRGLVGSAVLRRLSALGYQNVLTATRDQLDLRDAVSAAELRVESLLAIANLNPKHAEVPKFPVSERDLNFVLDEQA